VGQKNGTIGPMQKLSETAGFARLAAISRAHLLPSDDGHQTCDRELNDELALRLREGKEDVIQSAQQTADEQRDGQSVALLVLMCVHSVLRDQVGPLLLPVVRPKFLAGDLTGKGKLQRDAVLRRKRLEVVRPRPYVAAVFVSKDSGYLGVVVAGQLQNLAIRVDWFHGFSLMTLDHGVKRYLTHG